MLWATGQLKNNLGSKLKKFLVSSNGNRKQETGNRKYLFVPKTTKQSIQHKNHTIYYIYVDMIKRSSKNIEYGLKKKKIMSYNGRETPTKTKK